MADDLIIEKYEPLKRISKNLQARDAVADKAPLMTSPAVQKPTIEMMTAAQKAAQQKEEEDASNDHIAQALIGLLPSLLGGAIGGDEGGAAGGRAGMLGLETLEKQKKEYKEDKKTKAKEAELARHTDLDERLKVAGFGQKTEELGLKKEELALKKKEEASKEAERAGGGKPNGDQSKAAMFAKMAEAGNADLARLSAAGYDRASAGSTIGAHLPDALEGLKSTNVKLQEQAERNFLAAYLRRVSGATITASELAEGAAQFFDRSGDGAEEKAQKARNRQLVINSLNGEAGPRALSQVADVPRPGPLKKDVKMKAPDIGVTEALAADPLVVKYAKDHGIPASQAAAILYKRGYLEE